ncbi:hypothetical protein [Bradyrhizobium zhanjiangense]|uniref:Peptidase M41 domain-containing protein n=1 Tax=Bradyrhizobium zhanjiangense TaxID=1325107 RepID=A0A4Q0QAK9_9BRAD|nr:hypothetical protein [Bradyrhizobium zhanjiangense]RXG86144.1 hypothetical protein EAS61_34035 [Bradyrhizobium zhanjiangense]
MPEEITARDRRIALHEAAHLTVGRALGATYGGATIEEDAALGFSGLCWGPDFESRFAGEASTVIEQIDQLMPGDGDARDEVAEIYQHVFTRVVELTAGSEAEKLHFGEAWAASDDRQQERQLARLIVSSPQAAEAFIAACASEARAILERLAHVLEALTAALLTHRTLDGAQIDETISRAVATRQLADDRERRRRWQQVLDSADSFKAEPYRA